MPIKNTYTKSNYLGISQLLVFPAKNGGYFHRVFTLLPDMNYVINTKGKLKKENYTGILSYWDLKKGFVRGTNAKSGIQISTVKLLDPNAIQPNSSIVPIHTLPNVTVTAKSRITGQSVSFSMSFGQTDIAGVDLAAFWGMGDPNGGSWGEYGCSNCSNGSDITYASIPPEFWDNLDLLIYRNNLTNISLKELADSIVNNELKDLMIQFTGEEKNLTILNGNTGLTPPIPDTVTAITTGSDPNNIIIYLNETLLANGSREAFVETIIHEAFHAYFMALGTSNINDHANMLTNYASSMVTRLRQRYPHLEYYEAASLVYSGFDPYPNFTVAQRSAFDTAQAQFLEIIKQNSPYTNLINNDYNLRYMNHYYRNGYYGIKFQ